LATVQRGIKKSLIRNYAVFWQQATTYCQNMATSRFFFAPHNVATMGHFVSQKKPLNWLQEPCYCGKIFMSQNFAKRKFTGGMYILLPIFFLSYQSGTGVGYFIKPF